LSLEKIKEAMKDLPSPWLFKWHPLGKLQTRIAKEIEQEEKREEALSSER